jgi:hypothetical protein
MQNCHKMGYRSFVMSIPGGLLRWAALVVVMAAMFQVGCEVTSEDDDVTIEPDNATVILGQSITLRAKGADTYFWRLENESWGTLSAFRGETVVYTSRYAPALGASAIQKVYVAGEGALGSSNLVGMTGVAFITHISGLLSVSPSTATLRQGESVTFTAGGGGIYTWTLETPAYGILSKSTGNQVKYTSQYASADGKSVVQKITITSDNGGSTVVLVTQQPDGIISITPVSTTLKNGMSQIFTLYGGSDYTFTVSQPTWGIIAVLSENTFKYTSTRVTPPGPPETVTITVSDISSAKVTATIYNVP